MDWILYFAIDHDFNILKYNPLNGSSYIKLPKEFNHPKESLINIQNIDKIQHNIVSSDTYILQIIIQQELETLTDN